MHFETVGKNTPSAGGKSSKRTIILEVFGIAAVVALLAAISIFTR